MKITTSIVHVTTLIILFAAFAGYNFMFADAPANPPANNVAAPINVGVLDQVKNGGLAVNSLLVTGNLEVTGATSTFNQVRASEYCDKLGDNCFSTAGGLISLGVVTGETNGFTLTAQSLCTASGYDGVWAAIDRAGVEDIMCYTSGAVGKIKEVQTFVTAYYAMRSDPSFASFWGSPLPNYDLAYCGDPVRTLYRCGTGWKVVDPAVNVTTDTKRMDTYNKICSYMMVNGKWKVGTSLGIYDSGSDNDNNAIYWNGTRAETLLHDWNDYHDATQMTCIGDSVTTQGTWWIKSNRPEAYGRSGNKYPAPPVR